MSIVYIIIASIALCYIILIGLYNISWYRLKLLKTSLYLPKTKVSIILPVRNEANHILTCLDKMCQQQYPASLFEIIVVDDSSSDNTMALVNSFIKEHLQIKITVLELKLLNLSSKKQAIHEAIKITEGDLIITTDADCIMSEKWIGSIVALYEKEKPAMIVGPVCFYNEKNIFQKWQSLEFLSLIASGAASIRLGFPIMCNGANLAYEKKMYLNVGGFEENKNYSSGDDVFLMHQIKKKLNGKIVFLKSNNALVYTKAQDTLNAFINQRKRWVSKTKGYSNWFTIFVAILIFLYNFLLLAGFLGSFINVLFFKITVLLFLFKCIIDFPLLWGITSFTRKKELMLFYLPLQIIYPVYIVFTSLLGSFAKFEWKGRIIKK